MEFITPFISGMTILSQTQPGIQLEITGLITLSQTQPGIQLEITGLITLSQTQAVTSISFG